MAGFLSAAFLISFSLSFSAGLAEEIRGTAANEPVPTAIFLRKDLLFVLILFDSVFYKIKSLGQTY
jgi:hypothetical protein